MGISILKLILFILSCLPTLLFTLVSIKATIWLIKTNNPDKSAVFWYDVLITITIFIWYCQIHL